MVMIKKLQKLSLLLLLLLFVLPFFCFLIMLLRVSNGLKIWKNSGNQKHNCSGWVNFVYKRWMSMIHHWEKLKCVYFFKILPHKIYIIWIYYYYFLLLLQHSITYLWCVCILCRYLVIDCTIEKKFVFACWALICTSWESTLTPCLYRWW